VGFLYYVCNAVSIALGKSGILPPFLSAVLSPGLALLLSLHMMKDLP